MRLVPSSFVEKGWRDALARLEAGRLEFIAPNGEVTFAGGKTPGPNARFHIHDWDVIRRVMARGDIGLGEEYIAGSWETDNVENLISLFLLNLHHLEKFSDGNLINRLGFVIHNALVRRNSIAGSERNIKAHYDVGNDFYSLWLDKSMTYSSALYQNTDALYEAQQNKYDRILSKFDKPRANVLEIGCGWGGFAEYAAREVGARVTAITISQEQFAFAKQRMFEAGLADRAQIKLVDYRDVEGRYDRVASIEMFEAVGERYWPSYFGKIAETLAPGGRAGLQIITIRDEYFEEYRSRSDFIQKYIFPGGMLPSEERLKKVTDQAGFAWTGIERFGHDYADTLAEWQKRFDAAWQEIRPLGFDERFRKLWKFYLSYCEAGFRTERTNVVQLSLAKA